MSRRAATIRSGFSLVEVVIAVGVLAVAVAGILALLPGMTRAIGETSDELTAQRFPDAVRAELIRAARGGSLAALASRIHVTGSSSTLQLVASRDGATVQLADDTALPSEQQYYLIELWRFPSGPLAFDAATGAVLPALARVSWPYRRPASADGVAAETAESDRASFVFAVAITR